MNAIKQLHELGQQLWLDTIPHKLLNDGTLEHYINDLGIAGLTSNFQQEIEGTDIYDEAIIEKRHTKQLGEALFFDLVIEDLQRAADLFLPIHESSEKEQGWVSLELSPLLAHDAEKTIAVAVELYERAARPNLFIKIPGTPAGFKAVQDSIFLGVPVNVTLLFSCEQYLEAAHAYMRGIERRLHEGLDPRVPSVASMFISCWDLVVAEKVAPELQNRLGIAMGQRTYKAYRDVLSSPRWRKLAAAGATPQRLLWASTGTKSPALVQTLYVKALAVPDTINTLPEKTLLALALTRKIKGILPPDTDDSSVVLAVYKHAGINEPALAARLQEQYTSAFISTWERLLAGITAKAVLPGKAV